MGQLSVSPGEAGKGGQSVVSHAGSLGSKCRRLTAARCVAVYCNDCLHYRGEVFHAVYLICTEPALARLVENRLV